MTPLAWISLSVARLPWAQGARARASRLCQILIESGADVNRPLPDTGETPLHAAVCKANRPAYRLVLKVLLANSANPNCVTKASAETGAFMRDARTKAETPQLGQLGLAPGFHPPETLLRRVCPSPREAGDLRP